MLKKIIKIFLVGIGIVTLVLIILIIIGVLIEKGIIKTEEKPRISVEYTPGESSSNFDENSIPDSDYSETLQEALDNNGVKLEEGREYEKKLMK